MSTVCLCVWKCLKFYTSLFAPKGVSCTMLEYTMNCTCTIASMVFFCATTVWKNLDEVIVAKFILTTQMMKRKHFFNEVFKWLILLIICDCIHHVTLCIHGNPEFTLTIALNYFQGGLFCYIISSPELFYILLVIQCVVSHIYGWKEKYINQAFFVKWREHNLWIILKKIENSAK